MESDHEDDFDNSDDEKLDRFDYSAYREAPESRSSSPIDLLDDVTFLMPRDQPEPEPSKSTVRLETKEDLIKFHEDPQAEATHFPRVESPVLDESAFDTIEESLPAPDSFDLSRYVILQEHETVDLTKHLLNDDNLVIDDTLLDDITGKLSVEESKDYEKPFQGLQAMMKPPFQHVLKPNPTVSKIIVNEDGTKHIFVPDTPKSRPLDLTPTQDNEVRDTTQDIPPSSFDFSQYIDHPEYIDDPNPFANDIPISPDEPKFYEKPNDDLDELEDYDLSWMVAKTKRKRTKKSFFSKSGSSFRSLRNSTSSQSDSSSVAHPKKDFRYAGSG